MVHSVYLVTPWNLSQLFMTYRSLLVAAVLTVLFVERRRRHSGAPLPPGPKGLPVLGVFFHLLKYPELAFDRWAKKYGTIFSFKIGGQRFVALSDPQAVKDLLVLKGAMFSSRKDYFMKVQTILQHRGITAMSYGENWKKHRRIATRPLIMRAVATYSDRLELEAREMIRDLLIDGRAGVQPLDPCPYISRASLNNILMLVYGYRTETLNEPIVAESLRISREFMNTTSPVSNLTDFFPILQKLPNRMVARGKKLNADMLALARPIVADIEARLKRGDSVPDCLAKTLITTREEEELDDLDIHVMCAAFLIGGVETAAASQQWFSAHIVGRPDIQAKAREELDQVCGRDRLPTIDDAKDLPYVRAIVKEILRFHNPLWLGTPHMSTGDVVYRGYHIPKGTVVIVNTYTMHFDPQRHKNPQLLEPERYLGDDYSAAESANLADPMQRDHWSFGAGRRICPGAIIAERQIFLGIAHMLWGFDMEALPDEPIDLNEYDGDSGRSPVPFRIRLIPRDEHVAKVLEMQATQ